MPAQSRSRPGFTLIEVMVALSLGSMVVLMVHLCFGQVLEGTVRLEEARAEHTSDMEFRRTLVTALGSLVIGTSSSSGFVGTPRQMTFSAALGSPLDRPTPVRLGTEEGWLVLRAGARADSIAAALIHLDYLLSQGSESRWVVNWQSMASAPVAVRVRIARDSVRTDTLLLVAGTRG